VAGLRGRAKQGQGLGPFDVPAHSPEEDMREAIWARDYHPVRALPPCASGALFCGERKGRCATACPLRKERRCDSSVSADKKDGLVALTDLPTRAEDFFFVLYLKRFLHTYRARPV